MELALSREDEAFRDEVRRFLDENLSEDLREAGRKTGGVFADFAAGLRWHKILARQGWSASSWPKEHGGTGWSATQRYIFSRECTAVDAPRIFSMGLRMVGPVIMKFGTPEQKAKYLPRIVSGDITFCQGYSEPGSGSDLASLKTRAERDGDDYVINGTKTWISNGIEGSCFALLVKTDPAAEPRHKGMSLFLAPKKAGFRVGKKIEKLGYKCIDSAELVFDDYELDGSHLIGGVEGQGFQQATGGLELGRINVAARGVGLAEGALRLATEYAQLRRTFGKPIAEHQAIQLKLGEMVTRARAARLLTLDAAQAYDRGERCDMEAGMAKYFASEAAVENSLESMRIHGGYSYSKEFDVERYFRDAPLMCIGEGTNEMQRIIISKQWIKRSSAA